MTALEHRTAAKVCRCIERQIIKKIKAVPSGMSDREFNRKMNQLDMQCQEWALREIEHTQAAQRARSYGDCGS